MDLRSLIQGIQTGLVSEAENSLLPHESILRANTARDLLQFLTESGGEPRTQIIAECAKRAYPFSHIYDNDFYNQIITKILDGVPTVVISHQPTLFSYTGVYTQFILADFLVTELKRKHKKDSAIIYLCLDTDDARDRRIKTAHFPFPGIFGGSIPISYNVDKSYKNVPQFCVPFVNKNYKERWKTAIRERFHSLMPLVPRLKNDLRVAEKNVTNYLDHLIDETVRTVPGSFSDFSLSNLLFFAKDLVKSPIIPIRSSDLFDLGRDSMASTLHRWNEMTQAGTELLEKYSIKKKNIFNSGPGWLICKHCFFRNKASLKVIVESLSGGKTNRTCSNCDTHLSNLDRDFFIMPRVILEDILGKFLTQANLTLTYAGSAEHVILSNHITQYVFGTKPSIYTWHPRHFLGSPLEHAAIELLDHKDRGSAARKSLQLSTQGRDTLLYLSQFSDIGEILASWSNHFQNSKLTETMVVEDTLDLYKMYQSVV